MNIPDLDLNAYNYSLPEHRIAKFPLENRDSSKLLIYKEGRIEHSYFSTITKVLPKNSKLYLNNTKVIPARLYFEKPSGAVIEIFLLNPVEPYSDVAQSMAVTDSSVWRCKIGNKKKWKEDQILQIEMSTEALRSQLLDRDQQIVKFEWDGNRSFSEILEETGKIPLPPYLKREAEDSDKERYQTSYAQNNGAVAAPTAGLHFTDQILQQLPKLGISIHQLTLHVSAGTFQPITASRIEDHPMHFEQIKVSKSELTALSGNEFITAVGTTSLRTLESLYWFGAALEQNPELIEFYIEKELPYALSEINLSRRESIQNILDWMDRKGTDVLSGSTGVFIVPGYQFRMVDALITNFHMPKSTLILLIAAFIGKDWQAVYDSALQNEYRFLSYGDSSILFKA